MGTALNLRSVGHGFKSYSGQSCVTDLGKLFTPVPLSLSSITWCRPRAVMLCSLEGNCRPGGK